MAALDERAAVRRLYDRFGFGARPGELDGGDFGSVLGRLLDPAAPADAGVRATAPPTLAAPGPVPKKDDQAAKQKYQAEQRDQQRRVALWWLDRMAAADLATTERLTWFWHGHFATGAQKVKDARLMLAQNEQQRRLALGDFGALAKAMIVDPAMLRWLDGNKNKVGSPNENLAREFMELFAIGAGHFTETDVREAARALTGWTVRKDGGAAQFQAKQHDGGGKRILGTNGDLDAASFVDAALARPESGPFVVGRLWFRLVSATPPPAQVRDRLVAAYGTGRDIRAVLRAIATEPAFRDGAETLVKQPVEWLAGLLRALRLRPSTMDEKAQGQLVTGLRGMGQVPFQPPSVGGWAAGGAWLTTSAGVARLRLAQLVAAHGDLGPVGGAANRVVAMGDLLGVDAWSERTRNALAGVAGDPKQLCAVAACAPEYVVSG